MNKTFNLKAKAGKQFVIEFSPEKPDSKNDWSAFFNHDVFDIERDLRKGYNEVYKVTPKKKVLFGAITLAYHDGETASETLTYFVKIE